MAHRPPISTPKKQPQPNDKNNHQNNINNDNHNKNNNKNSAPFDAKPAPTAPADAARRHSTTKAAHHYQNNSHHNQQQQAHHHGKLFSLGLACLALGLFLNYACPPLLSSFIDSQLALTPGSQTYPSWLEIPVPAYQKFYFFNVTNAHDIEQLGHKPRLREIGPFTYRSEWAKRDVEHDLAANSLSFKHFKSWKFEPHLSIADHRLHLITLNAPIAITLTLIQSASNAVRLLVTFSLDGLSDGFFTRRSVKQLLFEGYPDLLTTFGPILNAEMLSQGGHFGYFNARNNSLEGTYDINTGADDLAKLNTINKFNGRSKLPYWHHSNSNRCNSLEGATTGELFPPQRDDDDEADEESEGAPAAAAAAAPDSDSDANRPSAADDDSNSNSNSNNSQPPDGEPEEADEEARDRKPKRKNKNKRGRRNNGAGAGADRKAPKQRSIKIFQPDFCRVWRLDQAAEYEQPNEGLRLRRFVATRDVFRNSSDLPENSCFFTHKRHQTQTNRIPDPSRAAARQAAAAAAAASSAGAGRRRNGAGPGAGTGASTNSNSNSNNNNNHQRHHRVRHEWPAGVFTLAPCKFNAPIYISMPHFLDADPYYLARVDGLEPDRRRHEFFIDLEPRTGSPVQVAVRAQINVAISKPPGLVRFRNVPEIMFPVFWQEFSVNLTGPVVDQLLLASRRANEGLEKISNVLFMLGGAILITLALFYAYNRYHSRLLWWRRPVFSAALK